MDVLNDKLDLEFEAIVKINDDTAIAASYAYNALFEVRIATGECTYLLMFPNEKVDGQRLYTKALYIEGKVYFVPAAADNIAIYDIETGALKQIEIPKPDEQKYKQKYKKNAKFNGGVIYGHYVFMTPCTYPGVIRININTHETEYFNEWVPRETFVFRKAPFVDDNKMFLPCTDSNLVLEFDLRNCKGIIHHIGKNNRGAWSICKNGENLWLAPQKPGPVVCWNRKKSTVTEYAQYPHGFIGNNFLFTLIFSHKDFVYTIPAYANMMLKINAETGEMEPFDKLNLQQESVVKTMFELDDEIYLIIIQDDAKRTIKISKKDLHVESYRFIFSRGKKEFIENYLKKSKGLLKEKSYFGLNEFLTALPVNAGTPVTISRNDIGKLIYKELKY